MMASAKSCLVVRAVQLYIFCFVMGDAPGHDVMAAAMKLSREFIGNI
jgi:hypothetical protein